VLSITVSCANKILQIIIITTQTCRVGDGMAKRERFATDHRKHTTEMCVYVKHGPYAYDYPLQPPITPPSLRQPVTPSSLRQPSTPSTTLGRPVIELGRTTTTMTATTLYSVASLVHRQNLIMAHFYRTTA